MGTLRAWWSKLTGQPAGQTEPPARPAVRATRKEPRPPGLELAAEPDKKKPGNIGAGGFDPYSSDAGYSKPHSWERVDHD